MFACVWPYNILVSRNPYCIASFYFCIFYYNNYSACSKIIKEIVLRSSYLRQFKQSDLCSNWRAWEHFIIFIRSLCKLNPYQYEHLRKTHEELFVQGTLGINGVLIWLKHKFILTCFCSKWRNKILF